MRRLIHEGMVCLLVALVALTGLAFASERGMSRIAGQVVLCSGHGPVAVWVDANGQPVEKTALCPDQHLTLLAAVAVPAPEAGFVPVSARMPGPVEHFRLSGATAIEPRGRSPPFFA